VTETASIRLFDEGWQLINDHHWRGYAWLNGAAWTPQSYQGEPLSDLLPRLNGCFCWVFQRENRVVGVMDLLGSYPLYYAPGILTDRPQSLQLDFVGSYFDAQHWNKVEALPGSHTIFAGCKALERGHWVTDVEAGKWRKQCFLATPRIKAESAEAFVSITLESCRRLIEYAAGRKIVVLLSDGYDSRLILAALKQLEYPDLLAVTYGIRGNEVVEKAERTSQILGIPHLFIDYSDAEHRRCLTEHYPILTQRYSNGQCVVQEQEIFAAQQLAAQLPANSILVPGISGDLQAGSYVPPYWFRWPLNRSDAGRRSWLRSRVTRYPERDLAASWWEKEIQLPPKSDGSELDAVCATEMVVTYERVSKYLCTTLRVYEYFGHDWYLPLWDSEFVDFWSSRSLNSRRFRKDYLHWCRAFFFEPQGIHFPGEGQRPRVHLGRVIRRFLPFGDYLDKGVPDPNCLAASLSGLLGRTIHPRGVNAALGQYLIDFYEQQAAAQSGK
jgi:asparagine synthase (glutamine-hydrolysing)